jgi:hypothetical protein
MNIIINLCLREHTQYIICYNKIVIKIRYISFWYDVCVKYWATFY